MIKEGKLARKGLSKNVLLIVQKSFKRCVKDVHNAR